MKTQLLIGIVAIVAGSTAHALTNGSFESPLIAPGTLSGATPTGWTGGAYLFHPSGNSVGDSYTWPSPQDGAQYENIGNTASTPLLQSFDVDSPLVYECAWWDSTAVGYGPTWTSPYSVSILDSLSQPVFTEFYDAYNGSTAPWVRNSITQSLSAGTYFLQFSSLNDGSNLDALIDNVAATPTPEPSSAVLLLSGGALCLRRRSLRTQKGVA